VKDISGPNVQEDKQSWQKIVLTVKATFLRESKLIKAKTTSRWDMFPFLRGDTFLRIPNIFSIVLSLSRIFIRDESWLYREGASLD